MRVTHQAAQLGMPGRMNSVEVRHFALEPTRRKRQVS